MPGPIKSPPRNGRESPNPPTWSYCVGFWFDSWIKLAVQNIKHDPRLPEPSVGITSSITTSNSLLFTMSSSSQHCSTTFPFTDASPGCAWGTEDNFSDTKWTIASTIHLYRRWRCPVEDGLCSQILWQWYPGTPTGRSSRFGFRWNPIPLQS